MAQNHGGRGYDHRASTECQYPTVWPLVVGAQHCIVVKYYLRFHFRLFCCSSPLCILTGNFEVVTLGTLALIVGRLYSNLQTQFAEVELKELFSSVYECEPDLRML